MNRTQRKLYERLGLINEEEDVEPDDPLDPILEGRPDAIAMNVRSMHRVVEREGEASYEQLKAVVEDRESVRNIKLHWLSEMIDTLLEVPSIAVGEGGVRVDRAAAVDAGLLEQRKPEKDGYDRLMPTDEFRRLVADDIIEESWAGGTTEGIGARKDPLATYVNEITENYRALAEGRPLHPERLQFDTFGTARDWRRIERALQELPHLEWEDSLTFRHENVAGEAGVAAASEEA